MPLTVDGLSYASSMVMLDAPQRKCRCRRGSYWTWASWRCWGPTWPTVWGMA